MRNSPNGAAFITKRVTTRSVQGSLTFPQSDRIIAFGYMGDYSANVSDGSCQYFAQGPGKVAIRPRFVQSPTPWPDTTRPCWSRQGPRFSDRHRRAFGANRDFAGASRCTIQSHTRQHSARLSRQALSFLKFGPP